eukprot:CAMPEP_0206827380 /NCGR_PEP_ID=MMETSP0975-20121206/15322_1 /ASSEMBLY_ACC=CAM_ASM_000399 /TAXON_ID=483370 /ORGANISM="non described non described, Strain CCMP2097" /LENGTH=61 /DNA_ID=CAMNT_0054369689 /DNA_START=78 /DNA_END=260 /DNA_ORIENTATION=+
MTRPPVTTAAQSLRLTRRTSFLLRESVLSLRRMRIDGPGWNVASSVHGRALSAPNTAVSRP